jgi:hypothetical protein
MSHSNKLISKYVIKCNIISKRSLSKIQTAKQLQSGINWTTWLHENRSEHNETHKYKKYNNTTQTFTGLYKRAQKTRTRLQEESDNNVVFWDIKTQFVLHRRHITSLLQSPASYCHVRFEVFTAVTLKNVVFWDIKTQFLLHRRNITSPLHSPSHSCFVRFEILTAVNKKNAVFWDVT